MLERRKSYAKINKKIDIEGDRVKKEGKKERKRGGLRRYASNSMNKTVKTRHKSPLLKLVLY